MASKEELNVSQAARKLGVSPRTMKRWAEIGKFKRLENGNFLAEEIEEAAEDLENSAGESESANVLEQLKEGHAQALAHTERMLQLLEKPHQAVLNTLTIMTERLNERLKQDEDSKVEMWRMVGEILMQKAEREAVEKQAMVRSQTMAQIGTNAARYIPKLIEQAAGKNMLSDFLDALSPEQRMGMWELLPAFEGQAGAKLEKILVSMKIPKPPNAELVENGSIQE